MSDPQNNTCTTIGGHCDHLIQKLYRTKSGISVGFDWPGIYCASCDSGKIRITERYICCDGCHTVLLINAPRLKFYVNAVKL